MMMSYNERYIMNVCCAAFWTKDGKTSEGGGEEKEERTKGSIIPQRELYRKGEDDSNRIEGLSTWPHHPQIHTFLLVSFVSFCFFHPHFLLFQQLHNCNFNSIQLTVLSSFISPPHRPKQSLCSNCGYCLCWSPPPPFFCCCCWQPEDPAHRVMR